MPIAEYTIPDWSATIWCRRRSTGRSRTGRRASISSCAKWSIRCAGTRICRCSSICRAGRAASRRVRALGNPSWLADALKTHRVVLPDQRGTGRSSRVEAATMARFPDGRSSGDFLAKFRANSIVEDFDHVRRTLFGGKHWERWVRAMAAS